MTTKIGIHGLTSCYGCQLSIAIVQRILDVADRFDIEYFYMLSSDGEISPVDVAFVEGSVSTEMDEHELRQIRDNADVVVAVGSCAIHGGVQGILADEAVDYQEAFEDVYGDSEMDYRGRVARPIDSVVEVDYRLPGCPPEEPEIMYYMATLAMGSWPEEKDYPVCAECRRAGNPCILIERGEPCLGPVTVAGCDARCISYDVPCVGCRGAVPHETAWFDSLARTFKNIGMDRDTVEKRMAIFSARHPHMQEMLDEVYGEEE